MTRLRRWGYCLLATALLAPGARLRMASGADGGKADKPSPPKPIEIATLKRSEPVSFEKELLPILSKKCLSCHNATTHESQFVLESPTTILKGGESGPSVVPGDPAKSLLLAAASRRGDFPMPPDDNDVGATPFTPAELGLLKLWIQQGATGSVSEKSGAVHWQPLPPGVSPIYAVAVTEDAQYAAASRANQIFLYHLPSGRLVTRLTDPALVSDPRQLGVAHLEMVHSLAFNPDGSRLASGGFREIKFWRRPNESTLYSLAAEADPVSALAASRDGRWVATGYPSGAIKLWEADSGRPAKTFRAEPASGPVTAIEFLRDNQRLVSASADKTLRLWSLGDGSLVKAKELTQPIESLAVMSDDARIAAAGADKAIFVWKPATDELASIDSAPSPAPALAAAPNDPTKLYSGHQDKSIRQWNLDTKKQLRQMDQGAAVTALAVGPDGTQLASAGLNNVVKLWKTDSGSPFPGPNKQPLPALGGDDSAVLAAALLERRSAAASAKAAELKQAAADAESLVKTTAEAIKTASNARDAAAKLKAERIEAAKAPTEKKTAADAAVETTAEAKKVVEEQFALAQQAAAKDPENKDLAKQRDALQKKVEEATNKAKDAENVARDLAPAATKALQELLSAEAASASAEQTAQSAVVANQRAIDAAPLAIAARNAAEKSLGEAQAALEAARRAVEAAKLPIRSLAYSPDGATLLAGGDHPVVSLWDAASGAPVGTRAIPPAAGAGNAGNAGNAGTAAGSGGAGQSSNPAAAASTTAGGISRVVFAGNRFLAAAGRSVFAWSETQEWKLERTIGSADNPSLLADRVLAVAFSPDGKLLASGGGEPTRSGELKLWSAADGAAVRTISPSHSDTIFAVEFSPDGKQLASAAADRMMRVFDVATGALAHTFDGHTHHVLGVAWRADGKLLCTAGADNSIKFWDALSGEQTRPAHTGAKELSAVRFLGLTNKAIVASGDHTLRSYDGAGTGGPERSFNGPADFLFCLAVSGDGKTVVAGGQDSVVWQWNGDNAQVVRKFDPPVEAKR